MKYEDDDFKIEILPKTMRTLFICQKPFSFQIKHFSLIEIPFFLIEILLL